MRDGEAGRWREKREMGRWGDGEKKETGRWREEREMGRRGDGEKIERWGDGEKARDGELGRWDSSSSTF